MSEKKSRRRVSAGLVAVVVTALGIPLGAGPAQAAGINDPPVLPHSIIVFPMRDFVSASGYADSDRPVVQVLRSGVVIGTSEPIVPQAGLVEVNHPGGGCWLTVTPDIRSNDVVRVITSPGVGDQTPIADVIVTQPSTQVAGDVVVKGTATAIGGGPIPVDQIEARLVANKQLFANGRRTLRATAAPGSDGTLAYDGAGPAWTATFPGLNAADVARAIDSENRILWRGRVPANLSESTIFEFGAVGGPALPCTAPLAAGPSTPDMTDASDTGASATDNVTRTRRPTFTGVSALPDAASFKLFDGDTVIGTALAGPGGLYSLTPDAPLADGVHIITASEAGPSAPADTRSTGSLRVTIDNAAPAAIRRPYAGARMRPRAATHPNSHT